MVAAGQTLVMRFEGRQEPVFLGDALLAAPEMIDSDFAQVIISLEGSQIHYVSQRPWQNPLSRWDVDNSRTVNPLDALKIINELIVGRSGVLPDLQSRDSFSGNYVDVNGDGRLTAADALRVINYIVRRQLQAEGELIAFDRVSGTRSEELSDIADGRISIAAENHVAESSSKIATFAAADDLTATDRAIDQLYSQEGAEREPKVTHTMDEGLLATHDRTPFR